MSARQVLCPRCGAATVFDSSNAFRPFCSQRCKLIDLGLWADEAYRVQGEDLSEDDISEKEDE